MSITETRNISLNLILSPGRRVGFVAVLVCLLCVPVLNLNSESYNYQTFYPLHYGRYKTITVTERVDVGKMKGDVGNLDMMSLGYITGYGTQPPIPSGLSVATPVGILANADLHLVSKRGIQFTPGSGGQIIFSNPYTYFSNLCKWYSGTTCPTIGGKIITGTTTQNVPLMQVAVSSAAPYNPDFSGATTNSVLCCRMYTFAY